MKMNVTVELNLRDVEVKAEVKTAAQKAMRDTVVAIRETVTTVHPWKRRTGTNSRSIRFEASGFDTGEGIVDQSKIEGAVYSTSGYGGFLETGTSRMPAFPYFKPAADRHAPKFPEKMKGYLS